MLLASCRNVSSPVQWNGSLIPFQSAFRLVRNDRRWRRCADLPDGSSLNGAWHVGRCGWGEQNGIRTSISWLILMDVSQESGAQPVTFFSFPQAADTYVAWAKWVHFRKLMEFHQIISQPKFRKMVGPWGWPSASTTFQTGVTVSDSWLSTLFHNHPFMVHMFYILNHYPSVSAVVNHSYPLSTTCESVSIFNYSCPLSTIVNKY